jgi:hypothetical protein
MIDQMEKDDFGRPLMRLIDEVHQALNRDGLLLLLLLLVIKTTQLVYLIHFIPTTCLYPLRSS